MSYEIIIDKTKKIESLLVNMGAEGKGLHEKVTSIENILEEDVVKAIRFMATIRNKFLHDSNFKLSQKIIDQFESTYYFVMNKISNETFKETEGNKSTNNVEFDELKKIWNNLSGWEKVGVGVVGIIGAAVVAWFNNL